LVNRKKFGKLNNPKREKKGKRNKERKKEKERERESRERERGRMLILPILPWMRNEIVISRSIAFLWEILWLHIQISNIIKIGLRLIR
jgi:hypothetical protein